MKRLTPKKLLQRLPIALARVKAGNTYEIHQIIYSFYRGKDITKKVKKNLKKIQYDEFNADMIQNAYNIYEIKK